MKSFFKKVFTLFCILIIILYLISCCSPFIAPLQFSYITLFAVGFPYLFVLMLFCLLISFINNKRLSFLIFIFLFCGYKNLTQTFAFNIKSKWQNTKKNSCLRILTWNVADFVDIRDTAKAHKQMLKLIASYNPDILCFQEYTNVERGKKRVSIRQKLDSMGYPYYFFSKDEEYFPWVGSDVIRGSALFSKHPLTDTERINIRHNEMNENLISATVLLNDKPIKFFTTHLASYALYRDTVKSELAIYKITYDRKRAIQYKLREIEQLHQQQISIIRNQFMQSPYPVIYCGDMNTTPCTYTYNFLKDNMQDAFLTKGSGIGATFYKVLPTLRIDYCFADFSFKINQCTVAQKKLSDHYPVITDISWK